MQEYIIIDLNADKIELLSWVIADHNKNIVKTINEGKYEQLITDVLNRRVVVLVPAQDVLLLDVQLPKMSRTRLLQALPFALEDELIDDVESSHFVPGLVEGECLPVAVVSHEKMQAWLARLKAWHIQAEVFLPAQLALPTEKKCWYIAIADLVIVRTGNAQGFACDFENIETLLQCVLAKSQDLPEKIIIYSDSQDTRKLKLDLAIPVELQKMTREEMLQLFALTSLTNPAINLLQQRYQSKKTNLPQEKKLIVALASLSIVLVISLIIGPITSYFILKDHKQLLDLQIAEIYKIYFPQAKTIVAPQKRFQAKIQKLKHDSGDNRLLLLLGYLGQGIQKTKNIKLNRLDFQKNQLTLELIASTSEDFSKFVAFLQKQGLHVKQQNVNLSSAHVAATLLIE